METKEKKVWDYIDNHQSEIVKLLEDLINIPTVAPYFNEGQAYEKEGEAQAFLKSYLETMGLTTELTYPNPEELKKYEGKPGYYHDHTFTGRPNLFGLCKGQGGGKSLLLSGHIDVVPKGSQWTKEPFQAKVEQGKIYGRGAVDMKGGIAAMTAAIKALKETGIQLKGDVMVGTVVDEECGGMGTLAFVDQGYRADGCLITEPTHLNVAPLCRGILWGKLIVPGRAGHIELKQGDFRTGGAVDGIDKALLFIEHIKNLNKDWAIRKEHKYLPIPCQIQIAQFNAGEYPTTYANKAEIVFNAQYLPEEKDENGLGSKVKKEIEDLITMVNQTDPWLKENPAHIEWMIDADCGETKDTEPFFQTVRDIVLDKNKSSQLEGILCHTDMGWFCNVGIPTINLGPGDPRLAHQSDEFVSVEELMMCTKLIASIIMHWCEAL